jgi:hypothetical protein
MQLESLLDSLQGLRSLPLVDPALAETQYLGWQIVKGEAIYDRESLSKYT